MSCRSGCATQDHDSYGECLRAATIKVTYANAAGGHDRTAQNKWERELADYRAARAQGIEPAGTDRASIDHAVQWSDKHQQAYDAHNYPGGNLVMPE